MAECNAMNEQMPLLLTESLGREERESAHQHIENCAACAVEWKAYRATWGELGELPEVEVPARVKEQFLSTIGASRDSKVIPMRSRSALSPRPSALPRWFAQAAAVVILVGGSYYAGNRTAPLRVSPTPATIQSVEQTPYSIAETRVLNASAISPNIEGRPNIQNVQFVDADASDNQIGVSFDVTSRVTVTGAPTDKSLVRLLSYVLERENSTSPSRSNAIDWVRRTYSDPNHADPEIADALAKVLRNDTHEGVRIRAVETLKDMSPASSGTRDALIDALKNDPNPAVRIKALEALSNLAKAGTALDAKTIDTLRAKASQDDENPYVRVKAAELLSEIP